MIYQEVIFVSIQKSHLIAKLLKDDKPSSTSCVKYVIVVFQEKENVDEIISRVKSDIRILLDISQRQGLSAIAKQELLKIKGDLGSLALR